MTQAASVTPTAAPSSVLRRLKVLQPEPGSGSAAHPLAASGSLRVATAEAAGAALSAPLADGLARRISYLRISAHRPLQLPLHLLHARHRRRHLAARRHPVVRRDRGDRRRACPGRRPPGAAHRRRAHRAQGPFGARPAPRSPGAGRLVAVDQWRAPGRARRAAAPGGAHPASTSASIRSMPGGFTRSPGAATWRRCSPGSTPRVPPGLPTPSSIPWRCAAFNDDELGGAVPLCVCPRLHPAFHRAHADGRRGAVLPRHVSAGRRDPRHLAPRAR